MNQAPLRLPALPRDVAAALTVSSVSRAVWAIAVGILVLTIAGVTELSVGLDLPGGAAGPVCAVVLMIVMLLVVARFPSPVALAVYIVVGSGCVWFYQYPLLAADPGLQQSALFVLNRPALALVLVGTASSSPLSAIWWGLGGFVAAQLSTAVVCLQLDLPLLTGAGPSIAIVNYIIVFVAIALIQRAQRGRTPDVTALLEAARLSEAQRAVDRSAAAIIHDTVLNDLALVMNGPTVLDDRARARLWSDVDTVTTAAENLSADPATGIGNLDAEFRNDPTSLASDFQWRGLSVDVAVDADADLGLSAESAGAALGAVRACLENVLNHSGVTAAELVLGGDNRVVTVMIVDAGVGFDQQSVPADRLGLRSSVVHRVGSAGGEVRIWSAPGAGTTVLLSLPLPAAVASARETADA